MEKTFWNTNCSEIERMNERQKPEKNLFPAGTALWIHQVQSRSDWAAVRRSRWRIHRPTIERFISVYRLAMDATRQGDDVAGCKSGACSGISSRHSIKGSSEPFASSARGFSGFCLSFVRSISEHQCFKNKNFSPLMPINCLIKCLINSEHFSRFVFKNKLMAF